MYATDNYNNNCILILVYLAIAVSSVRYHVIAFRLLSGQPRPENPARAHERAHEERISRGQVLGTTSSRRTSDSPRPAVASPTQDSSESGQWFQRHVVVLHQRRYR